MPFGVYVHIPFCAHRCDYCDFATWTDREHLIDAYVDACVRELEQTYRDAPAASSVFFGGGTPSLLPPRQLTRILDAIAREPGAEVTVECNPDSVDAQKFDTYRAAGVNRLSFGVQSMVPHVLQALGRTHDPANVERAVALARAAGFERCSVDLIYGTAGESIDDWRQSLEGALALGVEHVSAYALTDRSGHTTGTRHRGRPRGRARRRRPGRQVPHRRRGAVRARLRVVRDLELGSARRGVPAQRAVLERGRVPRHRVRRARPHRRSPVVEPAHARPLHRGGDRRARRRWRARSGSNRRARAEEAFALALRTRGGVGAGDAPAAAIDALAAEGLVEPHDGRIVLTLRGRLLASDVTARLVLAGAGTR